MPSGYQVRPRRLFAKIVKAPFRAQKTCSKIGFFAYCTDTSLVQFCLELRGAVAQNILEIKKSKDAVPNGGLEEKEHRAGQCSSCSVPG
jgi:hypothetical protein